MVSPPRAGTGTYRDDVLYPPTTRRALRPSGVRAGPRRPRLWIAGPCRLWIARPCLWSAGPHVYVRGTIDRWWTLWNTRSGPGLWWWQCLWCKYQYAVGFVDLVGFTPMSASLSARELVAFMADFEARSHEVALSEGEISGIHMLMRTADGTIIGAADSRREGKVGRE